MANNYIAGMTSRTKRVSVPNFFSGFDSNSDGSVLPISTATRIYNFDCSTGALTEGWGIEDSGIGQEGITKLWQFRRYDDEAKCEVKKLMFSCSDGSVYYSAPHGYSQLSGVSFSSPPFTVNYRLYGEDVILMCSQDEGMYVWNGIDPAYKVENAPPVTSLTMHYERMFVSSGGERNTVFFSDDLDPTNWNIDLSGGGFIQMVDEFGYVNRVISFLGYVYVLRERGISRITAYGDQSEFSVVNLFVSSGKIYPRSAAVCGDVLMFLADDGLYRFDGLSTRKAASAVCGAIADSPLSCGAYFDGKYFLALRTADAENEQNDGLLVYDLKTNAVSISRGVYIDELCPVENELFAVCNTGVGVVSKCGEHFSAPLEKTWTSGMLDFGTDEQKTVKEFCVDASAPFTLEVSSERGTKKLPVFPKSGLTSVRVNVSGRKIGFAIRSNESKIRISRPFIRISY